MTTNNHDGKGLAEVLKMRISTADMAILRELAREGDRTVAAEVRRAIRTHIEAARGATA